MFVFRNSFSAFISYSLGRVHIIWHYQNINKDVSLFLFFFSPYKLNFKEKDRMCL